MSRKIMPPTIIYNSELQILEVNILGDYFADEARQLILETIKMLEEHNCSRILVDARDSDMRLSTMEIFEAPQNISDAFAVSRVPIKKIKRAVVVKAGKEDPIFLENVVVNRGHRMKIFQDIDEAKDWLRK
jgi:hypothetical protein